MTTAEWIAVVSRLGVVILALSSAAFIYLALVKKGISLGVLKSNRLRRAEDQHDQDLVIIRANRKEIEQLSNDLEQARWTYLLKAEDLASIREEISRVGRLLADKDLLLALELRKQSKQIEALREDIKRGALWIDGAKQFFARTGSRPTARPWA